MQILHELDYSSVGFDFVGSGGQGGALIALGKTWAISLKHWIGLKHDSFGFLSGCMSGFTLSGVMLRSATTFPLGWKVRS